MQTWNAPAVVERILVLTFPTASWTQQNVSLYFVKFKRDMPILDGTGICLFA